LLTFVAVAVASGKVLRNVLIAWAVAHGSSML